MLIHLVEVSMIGFGICLSTAFFLRSSFLKRKNARKLEEIQKNVEDSLLSLGHKIELIDCHLQQVAMDLKTSLLCHPLRIAKVEKLGGSPFFPPPWATDAELPKALSAPPKKRGRPPKNPK